MKKAIRQDNQSNFFSDEFSREGPKDDVRTSGGYISDCGFESRCSNF